ncbi:unnamed protein product [Ilex paraguariensis]|uniref:Uncharacterized protein n=1 Tax=Ilex paraguariensis TaxID=185542 RepID=A0ABC8URP8_9AQUA
MGGCFSLTASYSVTDQESTANVISVYGDLREYSVPVTVSQVLQMETTSSSSSSCFLCNSDSLYYDEYTPALDPQDELQPGQIYFILPTTKLEYKLSASDMAALAVKASVALQNSSKKSSGSGSGRRHQNKARISPVALEVNQRVAVNLPKKSFADKDKLGVEGASRSGSTSIRKLQRYSSRRARMAVRSFRLRLTTIHEGSVLQLS